MKIVRMIRRLQPSREEKKRFDPDSLIRAVIAGPLLEKSKVFLEEAAHDEAKDICSALE
jgi:hypothetical protein